MYKDLEISFLFRKCEIENLEKCSTNFSVKKSEIENPEVPRNFQQTVKGTEINQVDFLTNVK